MKSILKKGFVALGLLGLVAVQAESLGNFPQVETETFDEEDFVFPDDMQAGKLNIVFLSMSNTREAGERQGEMLKQWHAELEPLGLFSDQVAGYYFTVIKAPFFVKGVIRRAMRDDYEGNIPLDQSGILFVKDMAKFADAAGLTIDDWPTIVLVAPDGQLLHALKGAPTEAAVDELMDATTPYTNLQTDTASAN